MVDVYVRSGKTPEERERLAELLSVVEQTKPHLRDVVALTLSHQVTGRFPASEVSVETHYMEASTDPQLDVECADSMECDVQIIVRSNWYPWREDAKDRLAAQIVASYGPFLPKGATAWVWLRLAHAGFAKWPIVLQ